MTRCNAAYERADLLMHGREAGNLLEARESVRTCAEATCQPWMVKDCTGWLSELERRIPSVVLLAKDARGRDVTAVTVSVNTAVLARRLDGRAIEMNPGERTFVFEGPGARRVERRALVREGQKDQVVAVTIDGLEDIQGGPSPAQVPRALDAGVVAPSKFTPVSRVPARPPEPRSSSAVEVDREPSSSSRLPWHPLGYSVGAVGAAGVVIGSVLGVLASVSNSASNANGHCTGGCDSEGVSLRHRAIDEANASTVAFAVGAGLIASGLSVLLFAPSGKPSSDHGVRGLPVVASGVAGVAFSGAF